MLKTRLLRKNSTSSGQKEEVVSVVDVKFFFPPTAALLLTTRATEAAATQGQRQEYHEYHDHDKDTARRQLATIGQLFTTAPIIAPVLIHAAGQSDTVEFYRG